MGKSSIITSFVSRAFVPVPPGATGKVQLPPDSIPFVGENIITTIIDTKDLDDCHSVVLDEESTINLTTRGGQHDNSISQSSSNRRELAHDIDSIVLVYDLERPETFSRIEEYWLPLIETRYHGEVRLLSTRDSI